MHLNSFDGTGQAIELQKITENLVRFNLSQRCQWNSVKEKMAFSINSTGAIWLSFGKKHEH